MPLRQATRQLVIKAATRLGLDAITEARTRRALRDDRAPLVRVLYFHGTPPAAAERFRRQLAWLNAHFEVIDFAAFAELFERTGARGSGRPAALLTFDDGFANNYEVAAPLLEDAGMRGVFFVVPSFSLAQGEEAARFYRERIIGSPAGHLERPMTPSQIRELAGRGHTIGNHTLSHAWLSAMPEAEYEREILASADLLESWTGRRVDAFAWPFVWDAITPGAHEMASRRHPFCFSPCAGTVNVRQDVPGLLWRTNAEADRSFDEFRFQCSGLADHFAAARRRRLRRLLAPAAARPVEAA